MKKVLIKLHNLLKNFLIGVKGNTSSVLICAHTRVINPKYFVFGKNVVLGKFGYYAVHGEKGKIILRDGTNVGMFSQVAAVNRVEIGENVLIGPNCYISDYNHEFRNPNLPVSKQGLNAGQIGGEANRICIAKDCWIGKNVVIVGNVTIGEHVVVGANSVVLKDIPDYCVAVGNPAKVIKRYDFTTKKWEKVG